MFPDGRAALLALYGAKIEALRRSLPTREIAAAVRAIRDERKAAMRALADRRSASGIAQRTKGEAERFSARLAQQKARDEARPS
jgi:ethanolamine ammonia-lyase large subunit